MIQGGPINSSSYCGNSRTGLGYVCSPTFYFSSTRTIARDLPGAKLVTSRGLIAP